MAMRGRPQSKRIEAILIGGDHLARSLATHVGEDFAEHFPPKAGPEAVRSALSPLLYDVWRCWAAIENARHLLGDPNAKPEKVYETCPECKGTGKVPHMGVIDGEVRQIGGREVVCGECGGQGRKQVIQ